MSRELERTAITIAMAIDDAPLEERLAAIMAGVDGVRLVGRGEPADATLISRPNVLDATTETHHGVVATNGRVVATSARVVARGGGVAKNSGDGAPGGLALTVREREVLALLVEGASNKVIANRLGISVHTAKYHVGSLIDKLDAIGRTDAVAHAARLGVIHL